jgi:phospholipid/cholesterol/gamma-HCH transport system ATP-binding protein
VRGFRNPSSSAFIRVNPRFNAIGERRMNISDQTVLEFRGVRLEEQIPYETGLDAGFRLGPGGLLLVMLEEGRTNLPVGDLAQGLVAPHEGEVWFAGENWQGAGPARGPALRSRIGRVFESGGWVSNLDVDENITLPRHYHGDMDPARAREDAEALARAFGFPELPCARPARLSRQELRRASWIRALLGDPLLLLLECPTRDLPSEWTDLLARTVQQFRDRGAAAVWLTDKAPEWQNASLRPTLKFRMRGSKMAPETEKA